MTPTATLRQSLGQMVLTRTSMITSTDSPATSTQRLYGYDRNGNRTSMQNNGITNGYDYLSNSNVLDTDNNGLVSHDASGNRTSDRGGLRTYDYNNAGRLWTVYEAGTLVATYTYNALGQRTRKTTAQGTTIYHYDLAGKVIAETTQTGAAKRDYVYMGNIPVAQIDVTTTDSVVYLHTDHLDTPRRATNQQGMVVWSWDGDAFGQTAANNNPLNTGNSTIVNLRFAGQYFDDETELHYNYFRYYDPSSGRYVTSDPIGLDGGLNTFGYVGGNPLSLVDYWGLAGTLVINSSGSGDGSSGSGGLSGHSRISYTRDGGGTVTYGTWGNNPFGMGNGLHHGIEFGRTGEATRSTHLNDSEELKLNKIIEGYLNKGE